MACLTAAIAVITFIAFLLAAKIGLYAGWVLLLRVVLPLLLALLVILLLQATHAEIRDLHACDDLSLLPRWEIGATLAVAAISTVLCLVLLVWLFTQRKAEWLIASSRVLAFSSLLSPLVPFALLAVAACLWLGYNVRRTSLLDFHADFPQRTVTRTFKLIGERHQAVWDTIANPGSRQKQFALGLILLIPFSGLWRHLLVTPDMKWAAAALQVALIVTYLLILQSFGLFVVTWLRLRQLLQVIYWHPLAPAFRRLPESLSRTPWKMWRLPPRLVAAAASVTYLRV
jgi:hypothetical protein